MAKRSAGKTFLNVNVSMQGQAACVLIGAA